MILLRLVVQNTQPEFSTGLIPRSSQIRGVKHGQVKEAAEYLSCAPWCVSAAIREKKLPYLQLGKRYVLLREDLDAFAAGQRVAA